MSPNNPISNTLETRFHLNDEMKAASDHITVENASGIEKTAAKLVLLQPDS
jgi:hypothetical protein